MIKNLKLLNNNTGSITVESLLTIPIFSILVLFLIGIVLLNQSILVIDKSINDTLIYCHDNSYSYYQAVAPCEITNLSFIGESIAKGIITDKIKENIVEYEKNFSFLNKIEDKITLDINYDIDNSNLNIKCLIVPKDISVFLSFINQGKEITIEKTINLWLTGLNLVENRGVEGLSDDSEIVYITNYGECYHYEECRFLKKSKIPIRLSKAEENYRPCYYCVLGGSNFGK